MPLVSPDIPASTPEYEALTPQPGESPMDALARVGDGIVGELAGQVTPKDQSRKNKKLPKQIAAVIGLYAQGFDSQEIADKLGITRQRVTALRMKARRDFGWSNLGDQIAHQAVPQAIENVIKHLEEEGSERGVRGGASTMTRAVLGGVGVFKSHSAAKVESKSETLNILRVEIAIPQLPPGVSGLALAEGSVLATPRRALPAAVPAPVAPIVEGEVVRV